MFYNFGARRNLSHIILNFIKLKSYTSILRKSEYILILLTINSNQIVKKFHLVNINLLNIYNT